jgi:hypothetical protein
MDVDTLFNNVFIGEKTRLEQKQQEIASAMTGQKRVIQLNESYRKRTAAYTKAVIAIVVALAIVVILKVVQGYIPIPEMVMTLVYILLLSVSILYAASVAFEVVNRDKTDYDRLDVPPPVIPTASDKERDQIKAAGMGNLLGTLPGMCIGKDCCDLTASVYNSDNAKCCPFASPFVDGDGKCSSNGSFSTGMDVNTGTEITDGGNRTVVNTTANGMKIYA